LICHDVIFALIFYAHLGVVVWCTVTYAPRLLADVAENVNSNNAMQNSMYQSAYHGARRMLARGRFLEEEDGGGGGDDYAAGGNADDDGDLELDIEADQLALIVCFGVAVSVLVSTLALGFMMAFAEALVKMSLFFNIAIFAVLSLTSLAIGAFPGALMFGFLTAIMCYYTYRVWERIPFAASNLLTAVTAVRANLGLALYAYLAVCTVFLWSLWWSFASLATIYAMSGCDADGNCESDVNPGIVFGFLLSYYWTVVSRP